MDWKVGEGWSCELSNDYTSAGYQVVVDEKAGVIEIRNQSTLKVY